jgi:hypothetical protein
MCWRVKVSLAQMRVRGCLMQKRAEEKDNACCFALNGARFWHIEELLPTEKEAPPFTAPARGFQKEPQHFA